MFQAGKLPVLNVVHEEIIPSEEIQTHTVSEDMFSEMGSQANKLEIYRRVNEYVAPNSHALQTDRITEDPTQAMIIRPITPSTLIALTEPCLLSWCCTIHELDVAAVLNLPTSDAKTDLYDSAQDMPYVSLQHGRASGVQTRNMWGY